MCKFPPASPWTLQRLDNVEVHFEAGPSPDITLSYVIFWSPDGSIVANTTLFYTDCVTPIPKGGAVSIFSNGTTSDPAWAPDLGIFNVSLNIGDTTVTNDTRLWSPSTLNSSVGTLSFCVRVDVLEPEDSLSSIAFDSSEIRINATFENLPASILTNINELVIEPANITTAVSENVTDSVDENITSFFDENVTAEKLTYLNPVRRLNKSVVSER